MSPGLQIGVDGKMACVNEGVALADPAVRVAVRAATRRGARLTLIGAVSLAVAIMLIGIDANMPEWLALIVVALLMATLVFVLIGSWVLIGSRRNRRVLAACPWQHARFDVTTRHTSRWGIQGDALVSFIAADGNERVEPTIYTTPYVDGALTGGYAPLVRVVADIPTGPIPTRGPHGQLDRFQGTARVAGPHRRRFVVTTEKPTAPVRLVALYRTRRPAESFETR